MFFVGEVSEMAKSSFALLRSTLTVGNFGNALRKTDVLSGTNARANTKWTGTKGDG